MVPVFSVAAVDQNWLPCISHLLRALSGLLRLKGIWVVLWAVLLCSSGIWAGLRIGEFLAVIFRILTYTMSGELVHG